MSTEWSRIRKALERARHSLAAKDSAAARAHLGSVERLAEGLARKLRGEERDAAETVRAAAHKALRTIDPAQAADTIAPAVAVAEARGAETAPGP
jgi:hypothetical protein